MISSVPPLGPYVLFVEKVFSTLDLKANTLLGPEGVPITVTNAGYIIFEFERSSKYAGGGITEIFKGTGQVPKLEIKQRDRRKEISYLRFKYMNSAMLVLLSEAAIASNKSFTVLQPCAPDNYASANVVNGVLHIHRVQDSAPSPERPVHALCVGVVNRFMETFNSVAGELGNSCMDICSLIYSSSFSYSKHDFSSSLLIGWAATEKIITELHVKYVGPPSKWKMDKNIKGLADANILTGLLLSQVEEAKQARNDFAHNLQSSSHETAAAAVFSAARLIGASIGRDLRPLLQTTNYG
ncbi:hypothetical protein [Pseudomonas yamanorum]|uniref:DUF4145 domain-containing protein n=1 Tax=Pseudomonas yamanorum TaxID=515393 RepID=A0A7Y8K3V4_9PSED|nr:hypothetical protein [Pseudomonas yamanorum]NWE74936.1 hypothetical protein [Pseudomonas yamanorum]